MNNESTSQEAPLRLLRNPLGSQPEAFRAKFTEALPEWSTQIHPFCVSTEVLDDDILAVFYEEMTIKLATLRAAMTLWDFEAVAVIAHALKGMGGSCGAPEISLLAQRLEEAARAQDVAGCARWAQLLDYWESA